MGQEGENQAARALCFLCHKQEATCPTGVPLSALGTGRTCIPLWEPHGPGKWASWALRLPGGPARQTRS